MKSWAAFAVAVVMLSAGSVTAQDAAPLPGSSCDPPGEEVDVFICPEFAFTKSQGSFVIPSVWVQDVRYGWVRMTACDELVIDCAENYIQTTTQVGTDAIEISLDDEEGAPQLPARP
jgi:hypothetical protein